MLSSRIPVSGENRPNLFDFATSELSQDAFICWLVSHLSYDGDPELSFAARSFVEMLYQKAHPDISLVDKTIRLLHLKPQYKKIDVYFTVEIDGKVISFLIEDKVNTSEHSEQTKRYPEAARRDDLPDHETIAIYYKTGYLFDRDHAVRANNFHIVDLEQLHAFFARIPAANPIYQDYFRYLDRLRREREQFLSLLETPRGYEAFTMDYVQYAYMQRLAMRCPEHLGFHEVYCDKNIGGTPWVQFQFVNVPGTLPGGFGDALFYRIDAKQNRKHADGRQRGFYLGIRYYANVKGHAEAKASKVKRLAAYRALFESTKNEMNPVLRFDEPAADYQGANESEVALLFFEEDRNTLENVLEAIPRLHQAFVSRVKKMLEAESHALA